MTSGRGLKGLSLIMNSLETACAREVRPRGRPGVRPRHARRALVAFPNIGPGFLRGSHIGVIFEILTVSLLVYFAFVSGPSLSLRGEISEKWLKLDEPAGWVVR